MEVLAKTLFSEDLLFFALAFGCNTPMYVNAFTGDAIAKPIYTLGFDPDHHFHH